MKNACKHMQIIASKSATGAPGADELKAINAYTLREHTADELYTRTMYLAHNGIDRDREVIDQALLADFVKTLPGKGLFIKHPMGWDGDTGPGEGRFFKAAVVEMSHDEARAVLREPDLQFVDAKAYLLEAGFYMVKTDDNTALIAKIDAGVAGDVSIGFSNADETSITDAGGNVVARRLQAPGIAYEGSLVWLGAQPGARVFKQATVEDKNMDYKQMYEALQTKHAALETEHKTAADELAAIKKVIGDQDIVTLNSMAAIGKQYHAKLIDEVVAAERVAGMVPGDDATTIADAKKAVADWDVKRLENYLIKVRAMGNKGAQLGGGDPNAGGAGVQSAASKDASNPMNNKAVTG